MSSQDELFVFYRKTQERRNMKNLSLTIGLWVLGAAMCAAEPIELNLASPEGTHHVRFYETKSASGANKLCYEVNYNGKQVIKGIRSFG